MRDALEALLAESCRAIGARYIVTALVFGAAVEATMEADGVSFVLQIAQGDAARCYRRTNRFNISYRGQVLDRSACAVVDAVHAALMAWEGSLTPGAEALLFTGPLPPQDGSALELLAVSRGVKPTCRIVVPPQSGEDVVEAARRLGLHARRADAYAASAADLALLQRASATSVVLAARTAAELTALAEAEQCGASPDEIGTLLGYPRCCIEAFIAHNRDPKPALRFAALQRTGATGSYLLNDVDGKVGLVSHLVCRYDCDPSIAIAGAVLKEFACEAPDEANAFAARLHGLMAAFGDGGTLRFGVGADSIPPRYSISAPYPVGDGATIWRWRAALVGAEALEVRDGSVRVLAAQGELERLETPQDRVQIRLFA